jgi:hypothetical protein
MIGNVYFGESRRSRNALERTIIASADIKAPQSHKEEKSRTESYDTLKNSE